MVMFTWRWWGVPSYARRLIGEGYLGSIALGGIDPATGELDWNFSVADSTLKALGEGQVLTQTYLLSLSDGNGGQIDETVTVTLTGANDAPVAIDDSGAAIGEDGLVNVSFSTVGSAFQSGAGQYTITPPVNNLSGALWSDGKIDLTGD